MLEGPFALAFGAGMVATINPCGFAMLPAYLSYFVGTPSPGRAPASLGRAAVVGAAVTAGFALVFAVVGTIVSHASQTLLDYVPYVTVIIGVVLAVLAVAMLRGFEPTLRLPKLDKGGGSREVGSMFLFGVSYAVASLGCTIGPFLGVTASTFREESTLSGIATFVVYGLGMGVVVVSLTFYTALARTGLVNALRRATPYMNRVAGAVLLLAAAYVTYYGIYEIRAERSSTVVRDPIVEYFVARQGDASTWIQQVGPVRLALTLAAAAMVLAVTVRLAHGQRRARVEPPSERL
jgi:cytochrome c-type biogenesis protein